MDTRVQLPPLSHDEILLLPVEQRIPYIEKILVLYPRWLRLLELIEECHTKQPYAAEPPCALILGPTGAGKSELLRYYLMMHPQEKTKLGKRVPVLLGRIPAFATISSLLTALLAGLGDPRPDRGTIDGKTIRLKNLIRDCGVQVFILDELQHFYDQDNKRILLNVSNWLEALIKDAEIACVLVGLQGQANQVVDANPQLARLFGDPEFLKPFRWDRTQPETIDEFRKFLIQIQQMLPLREAPRSKLATMNCATRCFVASDGLMAHLMKLIRGAATMALKEGQEYLTEDHLSRSFVKHLAPDRRGIVNPFVGPPPKMSEKKPDDVPVDKGERATNNRGGAKK